ncbi:UDP-4-amino-4,6-dideoxy-N-acetyl-beta-L-altrosamine transaminase [Moraxella osloensis]|nr:UDP-4-amino-4,6-dideoxy-N-acetyl-beta-L-altrosamine transaminase [Moraxella osloensis]MBL7667931.1 UDP-4-amino-4,6-dideoxy-N-acetyl-beta-L-altrosamine transaminase [Moraxella osloensis]
MANQFIPYGRQHITQTDIDAVVAVLQSDFLTQGSQVPAFEERVATYTGAKFGVAVNSATSALHIACLALGLGQGEKGKDDWLWTTPITFTASANCGLYCGANIDFVDIDPLTLNMSINALAEKLQLADAENRLPKIVIPVHFTGEPCDMAAIHALAQQYGFKVIEDASHAIGGKYHKQPIGNCEFSDITVFSFHPVKIITTAEGGLATTNDPALAEKMQLLRSHGITRDANLMTHEPDGGWYYQQIDLGFNYRMTELQGALGMSQMKYLDDFVTRRHQLGKRYDELLTDLPIILPYRNPANYSGFHLYPIQLTADSGKTRKQVFDSLRAQNIGVNVHYIPVHTQPYYAKLGFKQGDFPHAESYYAQAISLPLYYDLSEASQAQVVNAIYQALA